MDHSTPTTDGWDDQAWDELCINPFASQVQQGREHGWFDALQEGFKEGYSTGRTTAIDIGMEIGFIQGMLHVVMKKKVNDNDHHDDEFPSPPLSERVLKTCQALQDLLNRFPQPERLFASDPEKDTDMMPLQQEIQSKFKLLMVQLGIPHVSLKLLMEEATSTTTPAIATSTTTLAQEPEQPQEWDW